MSDYSGVEAEADMMLNQDRALQNEEVALAVTHETLCSACGGEEWYEYQGFAQRVHEYKLQLKRLTVHLYMEREMLRDAIREATHLSRRVDQRLERNHQRQLEMLKVGFGPYHGIDVELANPQRNGPTTPPASPVGEVAPPIPKE
uniref:Zf-HC2 domain-containing protein n=1 Tax=Haemonchus contortus TaxID=6289 RepID=A0A7I4Z475_HAECO|nr:unnamed protein product [Haemonchus contortus]